MDEPLLPNHEERIFTLNDVKRLFFRLRKKIFRAAWIGALCAAVLISLKAPQYKVEASFREENEKGQESVLQNFMGGIALGGSQPQASIFMKSFEVLKPLIHTLGLQASVPKKSCLITKICRRIWNNWKMELGGVLADPDVFVFQNVQYEGPHFLSYTMCFQDSDHFVIFEKGKKLASGTLGTKVCLPECSFMITQFPHALKIGTSYSLQIDPWISVAKSLRKELQIQGSKNNKSILELSLLHRDRHLASHILNELMMQYQYYLKRDHDQIALKQLEYLNQKQGQVYDKMSGMFQAHAAYLKNSLETKGIAGLKDEIQTLLEPYHKFQQALLMMDVELSQLDQIEKGGNVVVSSGVGPFFQQHQQLVSMVQDLKQQRDLLEISLQRCGSLESVEHQLVDRQIELKEIRERQDQAQYLLDQIKEKGNEEVAEIFNLENHLRLLSVQEKMAQEKCFYGDRSYTHFDGIDLNTARALFVEYNSKLDTAEGLVGHYQRLIEKIEDNDFEISSLGAILPDPLSQNLILEANKIAVQLKDEKYHSAKEGERWREEIAFQKKVLTEHLQQLCKTEQLNADLIREKMVSLQQVSLDCISREISVLHERMRDVLKERRAAILQEKKIIEEKMEALRCVSADFPEKWRQEKWLDLNMQVGVKMIEVMTELVEGKTVAQHLHHVESKPLDLAIAPLSPNKPGLLTASFLGFVAFGSGLFFVSLLSAILAGFPVTLERLKAMKYPALGQISSISDGPCIEPSTGQDLELLRQLSLFIDAAPVGKVIGLLENKGPDYSYAFAENLARMSRRSLILRCDFHHTFHPSDVPGILQVWKEERKDLFLRKKDGFDYVTAGGFTLHGTEVIQSRAFQQMIASSKEIYDFIFVLFRSPLSSAESMAALRFCDKAIVTVTGEAIEELTPFMQWAYYEDKCRLTFITSDDIG